MDPQRRRARMLQAASRAIHPGALHGRSRTAAARSSTAAPTPVSEASYHDNMLAHFMCTARLFSVRSACHRARAPVARDRRVGRRGRTAGAHTHRRKTGLCRRPHGRLHASRTMMACLHS